MSETRTVTVRTKWEAVTTVEVPADWEDDGTSATWDVWIEEVDTVGASLVDWEVKG
jgi:hypothetical protein